MDSTTKAQRELILIHLLEIGPISTLEARNVLDVPHPAGRIKELRELGAVITTERIAIETPLGVHKVAVYRLVRG